MQEVLRTQPEMSFLRGFLHKVWAIFEVLTTGAETQARLAELKQYVAHHENDGYTKSISFLDDNFKTGASITHQIWPLPAVRQVGHTGRKQ
jgi:hypothetical protein